MGRGFCAIAIVLYGTNGMGINLSAVSNGIAAVKEWGMQLTAGL